MKKSMIAAGAASLALAAMPVLGVLADTTEVTDKLTLTVTPSCTYDSITPAAAGTATGNSYSASTTANALVSFTAAGSPATPTSLTVKCNDPDGYSITPTFTGLDLDGTPGAQSLAYGSNATAGSQTWTAYYSKNGGAATAFTASGSGAAVLADPNPSLNDTWAFSYKAGTGVNQAAGTYTGQAVYNLAVR